VKSIDGAVVLRDTLVTTNKVSKEFTEVREKPMETIAVEQEESSVAVSYRKGPARRTDSLESDAAQAVVQKANRAPASKELEENDRGN